MRDELSEPEFYGDLVYKLKKIVGSNKFSALFLKTISHFEKIGYNINVLQQTGQPNHGWQLCFPLLLHTDGSDFRLYDGSDLKTYILMRWEGSDALAVFMPTRVYLLGFFCSGIQFYLLLSPYICFISFIYLELYVLGDDAWKSQEYFMQTKHSCVLIHKLN